MAKLRLSLEFVELMLFGNLKPRPCVNITGGSFDPELRYLDLEVTGADVPESAVVKAIFTQERLSVKFEPAA